MQRRFLRSDWKVIEGLSHHTGTGEKAGKHQHEYAHGKKFRNPNVDNIFLVRESSRVKGQIHLLAERKFLYPFYICYLRQSVFILLLKVLIDE